MFAWFGSVLWEKQTFRYMSPAAPQIQKNVQKWKGVMLENPIIENPTTPPECGGHTKPALFCFRRTNGGNRFLKIGRL